MKKLILSTILFCFLAVSCAFAQSVTIVPNGDKVMVTQYSSDPNFTGRRASGSSAAPVGTLNGNRILNLGGRGYIGPDFSPTNNASIVFGTAEAFTPTGNGTWMTFATTPIGTTTLIDRMKIDHDGNVGIGTSSFSPGEKFAVKGSTLQLGIFPGYLDGTPDPNWTTIDMNSTRGLRVWDNFSVSGTVGIGTTAPATTLDVRGSAAAITVGTASATGGALYLGNSAHGLQRGFPTLNADNNVGLYTTAANLYLSANGKVTDKFILTFNGEVGIGTSDFTPGEKFAVKAGTSQFGIMPGMLDNVANAAWTTLDMKGFNNGIRIWDNLSVSDKVGIGTTTPDSPLQVKGAGFTTPSLARAYFTFNTGSSIINNTSSSGDIRVHADGYFWADGGGFVATSDARIKNILGRTNTNDDLEKLRKIAVTDYKYIDEVSNGSTPQKKVIAQQVKEIFPIAINQSKGIIPNVYQVAKKATVVGTTTQIVTTKAHDFVTGDVVKLIVENAGEKIVDVTVIDSHTFSVNQPFNTMWIMTRLRC